MIENNNNGEFWVGSNSFVKNRSLKMMNNRLTNSNSNGLVNLSVKRLGAFGETCYNQKIITNLLIRIKRNFICLFKYVFRIMYHQFV